MTSEIEKQFMEVFRIKPYYKYLLIDKTTKWHNEKLMDKTNFIDFVRSGKDYLLLKVVKYYPQITDRILLRLIQIACEESIISLTKMKNGSEEYAVYLGLDKNCIFYEKTLKDIILRAFIEYSKLNDVYTKIQALFKEDN